MRADGPFGAEPPSLASTTSPAPNAAKSNSSNDGLDNPYQCAFCGRPAAPEDKRCPYCGQGLTVVRRATITAGPSLRTAVFLIGVLAAVALLEIAPPLFAYLAAQGRDPAPFQLLLQTPAASFLLGDFLAWPGPIAASLLGIAIGRSLLLIVGGLGLWLRWSPIYFLVMGLLALDLLWNLYRLAAGYAGPVGAVGNMALALGGLWMLFASDRDFAVVRRRLLVQPDGGLRGDAAFYQRGHEYRKLGMWALAAAQWRMAIGAQPRNVQYYKDLALAYGRLGRAERGLRLLEEAGRQAPGDAEVEELRRLMAAGEGEMHDA